MKIVFLGATRFSEAILLHLLENNFQVGLVFSIPGDFTISYSKTKVKNYNFSDIAALAEKYDIPYRRVESGSGSTLKDHYELIREFAPDVILVMGWYYMVPREIRSLAKYGAWGIHASLLPEYAGGAPLVWAMIEGKQKTGVTLFRLADGVDDGDIISQGEFDISEEDTIKEVYDKATDTSKSILVSCLSNPEKLKFSPQDKTKIKVFPQRKPEDGQIDLGMKGREMYNFIRAQAPPYPGAFIRTVDNKRVVIEKARLENND